MRITSKINISLETGVRAWENQLGLGGWVVEGVGLGKLDTD